VVWAGNVASVREVKNDFKILVGNPEDEKKTVET
jgi:hypothetical protein